MTATAVDQQPVTPPRAVVYRPESAVFWVFVVALVVGVTGVVAEFGAAVRETLDAQVALGPVWLGFMAFLVWLILRFDTFRSARRYPQALAASAALGGSTALVMALNGNDALGQLWAAVLPPEVFAAWNAALTAPFMEEAAKAMCAAVVLVLCAAVLNRIAHALVVGMFVGLGFDVMEDLVYASRDAINSLDSDLSGAGENLAVRIFTAVPAHWAYSSLASVGVLVLLKSFNHRTTWPWWRRFAVAGVMFASASFMHFVWDSPNGSDGSALLVLTAKIAINLLVFLTAVLVLLRDERQWVTMRVAEARDGGRLADIEPAVLDSLPTRRLRRRLRRQARRAGGRSARKAMRHRQNQALDRIQALDDSRGD
ncbi:PrsW family intramembrane metalloprotease [Mycobacterium sp. DSM 3803]|nr:PrsW family intramembrane metalloprotease [Mycobacterium sp. DSM 3803]